MIRVTKALGAAAVAAALAGCSGGIAGDWTGQDITRASSRGLSTLLGVKPPEEQNQEIELTARSPLVIPPNYKLRPPVNPEQEETQLGAQWPEDPDVKAKEVAALDEAREREYEEKVKLSGVGRSASLTNEELNSNWRPEGHKPDVILQDAQTATEAVPPDELLRRHRERKRQEELAAQQGQASGQQAAGQQGQQATGAQQQEQQTAATTAPAPQQPRREREGILDRLVFWD